MTEHTPKPESPAAFDSGAAEQSTENPADHDRDSPIPSSLQAMTHAATPPPPSKAAASPAPVKYEDAHGATLAAGIAGAPSSASSSGAPVRQYLNEFVTPYLLEGMKRLAREQPANPLEVLGKFLMEKSMQVEGNARDTRMGDVD